MRRGARVHACAVRVRAGRGMQDASVHRHMESTSTGMASEKDEAVVSAAQNLYARPSEGGRVLLVVRLRTAYACSAFWYTPGSYH